jgi:hypothetical protein
MSRSRKSSKPEVRIIILKNIVPMSQNVHCISITTISCVMLFREIHLSIYDSTALVDLGRFFSFLIHTRSVGLFGRGISPSQGRYLHTEQHKHRINAHTGIHASSGFRTHNPSVRAGEDSSCLRPRGHCDRLFRETITILRTMRNKYTLCAKCIFFLTLKRVIQ